LAVDLLALVQMSLWGVMAVGLFQRRRYTAAASLAGAGVLGVMAIACPAILPGHGIAPDAARDRSSLQ
jgi:hypothetical protein